MSKAATSKPVGEYAGITVQKCPAACNVERCVISGQNYCAHPHKGGLQGQSAHDQDALARLNQAKKLLGENLLDARYG